MLATPSGSVIKRNGATVTVDGSLEVTTPGRVSHTVPLDGIVWARDQDLFSSWVYSFDTYLGETKHVGLGLDGSRPITVFRIGRGGILRVEANVVVR